MLDELNIQHSTLNIKKNAFNIKKIWFKGWVKHLWVVYIIERT